MDSKISECVFPKRYSSIADVETGRCFILMEFIEGAKSCQTVFGIFEGEMRLDLESPLSIGSHNVTALEILQKGVRAIGDFHGH
jgi:hypothetical protein